jgi:uncharacterized damage-inducible protein DinB
MASKDMRGKAKGVDILDRLLGHDEGTTRQVLLRCRELTSGQMQQSLDVGHATIDELSRRFDAAYADFAAFARQVADQGRLDRTYMDTLDSPPGPKTFGGTIVHVITHDMLHRGELLHMLGRLGLRDLPEGDALSWEAQQARG